MPEDLYQRYLGCLGILGECSVYVPEDIRETIERAMRDACQHHSTLRWKRILNRIEIEPIPDRTCADCGAYFFEAKTCPAHGDRQPTDIACKDIVVFNVVKDIIDGAGRR